MRESLTDAQQTMDLDIIERHTRQAQRVLQELLNFARPKAAGSGTADACAVAASVTEVFSVKAAKKRVRLDVTCPPETLMVRMGVGELEQVVSNLVINALDAVAEDSGEIMVRVESVQDGVAIVVDDNGPGVAAQEVPHIFDPFYTTKAVGAGTGLGLAVVYGLVRDVGGEVGVQRSKMGGACFRVVLPAASENQDADPLQ